MQPRSMVSIKSTADACALQLKLFHQRADTVRTEHLTTATRLADQSTRLAKVPTQD